MAGAQQGVVWTNDTASSCSTGGSALTARALVVEAPDGSGRRVLLSTSRPMTSLVWSPDGNQIAFALLP